MKNPSSKRNEGFNGGPPSRNDRPTVTLATVGRVAGVSPVTVSRALNHPDKVSAKTLERVQDAIRVTGYVPDFTAAALASRRTQLIAAFIPSITNLIYSTLIQRFSVAMRNAGYQVLLSETGYSQEEEFKQVTSLLSRRPEGILLTGVHHSLDCRRALVSAAIPVVEVWDITETPIDVCIGFSHIEVGRSAAEFVHERGFARAAAILANDERAIRRMEAFRQALQKYGECEVPTVRLPGGPSIKAGREALATLMAGGFRDGVVFCSSDWLAHGVLIEAQARGLSVPGDIAVIGFGDQDFAAQTFPSLTTVKINWDKIGSQAANVMLHRLQGAEPERRSIDIGFEMVVRESA